MTIEVDVHQGVGEDEETEVSFDLLKMFHSINTQISTSLVSGVSRLQIWRMLQACESESDENQNCSILLPCQDPKNVYINRHCLSLL